jgi:hypothetical protein
MPTDAHSKDPADNDVDVPLFDDDGYLSEVRSTVSRRWATDTSASVSLSCAEFVVGRESATPCAEGISGRKELVQTLDGKPPDQPA